MDNRQVPSFRIQEAKEERAMQGTLTRKVREMRHLSAHVRTKVAVGLLMAASVPSRLCARISREGDGGLLTRTGALFVSYFCLSVWPSERSSVSW